MIVSCLRAAGLVACLAFAALPAPAQEFDIGAMTDEERAIFRNEVRNYLMDNPEVLLEAIQVLEDRDAEAQGAGEAELIARHSDALFDDDASWVGGNPDGDVTLVEFLDYRCSFCRRAHPEVTELLDSDGDIRLIVKEFPILGEDSTRSSRFAVAVKQIAGDDAYARVHDALMTLRARVTPAALDRIARDAGIDADAVLAHMESAEVTRVIERNYALAQALQITGTPTFILEDRFLRGYAPADVMLEMVEAARGG